MYPKWRCPEGHHEVTYEPPLTLQVCGQRLNDEGFHYRHPICTLGLGLGHPRVKAIDQRMALALVCSSRC